MIFNPYLVYLEEIRQELNNFRMTKKQEKKDEKYLELENKVGELTLGWQRCLADFQNFKKKTEEDRQNLVKNANFDLIFELLPVLDNFQLAAKHIPKEIENNNWVLGVKQIEKQFESILSNLGLVKIQTLGQQFDPNIHEAIEMIKSDKQKGEIVEEILSGYQYKASILRPAKVKVAA